MHSSGMSSDPVFREGQQGSGAMPLPAHVRPVRATRNHILLVDDDPLLLRLTEAVLTAEGYRIHSCSDALRALAEFRRHPGINLLLTDIHMPPGMSGLELAGKISAENPDLPVVVMSGAIVSREQESLMREHSWAFVDKPLSVPRLLSVVSILLRGFSPRSVGTSQLSRKAG